MPVEIAGKATEHAPVGHLERAEVAGREKLVLAMVAAPPHRASGVDDPPRLEPEARRGLRVARVAAAERAARRMQLRLPGGPVDGSIDSPASGERRVRGVDDGVDVLLRD